MLMQALLQDDDDGPRPASPSAGKSAADGQPIARACDQCRARKIRCDRATANTSDCSNCVKAGVACDFSARSRRVNHTKKLVDDFASVGSRLDTIDASLLEVLKHMKQPASSAAQSPAAAASNLAVDLAELKHFCRVTPSTASSPSSSNGGGGGGGGGGTNANNKAASTCSLGDQGHRTVNKLGLERFYGPTAMTSLFHSSRIAFEGLLGPTRRASNPAPSLSDSSPPFYNLTDDETFDFILRKVHSSYPFDSPDRSPSEQPHDRSVSIARPPKHFLDASLDYYFRHFNAILPIFDERMLRSAIETAYSFDAADQAEMSDDDGHIGDEERREDDTDGNDADERGSKAKDDSSSEAYNLCFTNIIVLVLGAKLRFNGLNRPRQNVVDDELFRSFLGNACRALTSLDSFLQPKIVHIQALASLALVAAEYVSGDVFDELVTMACRTGSVVGLLPQQHEVAAAAAASRTDEPLYEIEERRKLFWSLYHLDKKRVFLTGRPCNIYLFDSALELPLCDLDFVVNKCISAQLHLMSIWEQIYIGLYSPRAQRQAAKVRADQVATLGALCEEWKSTYDHLLTANRQRDETAADVSHRLELRYYYLVSQVLIHRCGDTPEASQRTVTQARAALKLISGVQQSGATPEGVALLGRLFIFLPPVAFHHLLHRCMTSSGGPGCLEDVELLRSVTEALTPFVQTSSHPVYTNQLHAGMTWCNLMLSVLKQIRDKRRSRDAVAPVVSTACAFSAVPRQRQVSTSGSSSGGSSGSGFRSSSSAKRSLSSSASEESLTAKKQSLPSRESRKAGPGTGGAVRPQRGNEHSRETSISSRKSKPQLQQSSTNTPSLGGSQASGSYRSINGADTRKVGSSGASVRGQRVTSRTSTGFPPASNHTPSFGFDAVANFDRSSEERIEGHEYVPGLDSSASSEPVDECLANVPSAGDAAMHDMSLLNCPASLGGDYFMFDDMGFVDGALSDQLLGTLAGLGSIGGQDVDQGSGTSQQPKGFDLLSSMDCM